MTGKPVAMENFAGTRGFKEGRIDIIRSTTSESLTFLKAMVGNVPVSNIHELEHTLIVLNAYHFRFKLKLLLWQLQLKLMQKSPKMCVLCSLHIRINVIKHTG